MSTEPRPIPAKVIAIVAPMVTTLHALAREQGAAWTAAEARNAATDLVFGRWEAEGAPELADPFYRATRLAWADGGTFARAFDQLWAEADRAN